MTTLMLVDGQRDEPRTTAVARRLRGEIGQLNLSISEVARRTGMSQPALSRRMTGELPFDIAELDLICDVLGISYEYIATGIRPIPSEPPPPPLTRGGSVSDKKRQPPGTSKRRRHTDQPVGSPQRHLRPAPLAA